MAIFKMLLTAESVSQVFYQFPCQWLLLHLTFIGNLHLSGWFFLNPGKLIHKSVYNGQKKKKIDEQKA